LGSFLIIAAFLFAENVHPYLPIFNPICPTGQKKQKKEEAVDVETGNNSLRVILVSISFFFP